jgi:hypothetical protein
VIANVNNLKPQNVISFSSKTIPVLAVLRKNSLENRNTQIIYTGELPEFFDAEIVKIFTVIILKKKLIVQAIPAFSGSTIFISQKRTLVLSISLMELTFIGLYANLCSSCKWRAE